MTHQLLALCPVCHGCGRTSINPNTGASDAAADVHERQFNRSRMDEMHSLRG